MLLNIIVILGSLSLLIWGADRFVTGASATANNFGVSPLIIGLTVVGFGTSAPEMIVSIVASMNGTPNLAVGNALGSNITNIALVLGLTALVCPLFVHSKILQREYPIMFFIMLLVLALFWNGQLSRLDGGILVTGMFVLMYFITRLGLREKQQQEALRNNHNNNASDPLTKEFDEEIPKDIPTPMALFWLALGLIVLLISSKMLVWGSVNIAHEFGVSDLVIGLTIVAIGTSLPELAASVASALKGEHDIAIGNIIGSNMFNLLGVLGIPGLFGTFTLDEHVLSRDYPVMLGLYILLFIFAYGGFKGKGRINRIEGSILLVCYIAYLVVIYQQSI
jgi:cation:H+ antiporter